MSENDYKEYDYLKLFQQLRKGHLDNTSIHFEVPQSRDLANASIPLKRGESRALKRKKK